jgi:hypothetical protein
MLKKLGFFLRGERKVTKSVTFARVGTSSVSY